MSTPSPFEQWHKRICQVIGDMAAKNMQGSAGRRDLRNWSAELMATAGKMLEKAGDDDLAGVLAVMTCIQIQAANGVKTGYVPCPKCGGNVKFNYSGPRAVIAKCETGGCIRFMA